jgi:hypothetical protein
VEKDSKAARETNKRRTERSKKLYDLHVRALNRDIKVGDKVIVKTFVVDPERSVAGWSYRKGNPLREVIL